MAWATLKEKGALAVEEMTAPPSALQGALGRLSAGRVHTQVASVQAIPSTAPISTR